MAILNIIWLLIFPILILILKLMNFSKEKRSHQWYEPVAAIVFTLAVLIIFNYIPDFIIRILDWIHALLSKILGGLSPYIAKIIIVNAFLLAIYLPIKLAAFLSMLTRKVSSKIKGFFVKKPENEKVELPQFLIAYYYDEKDNKIYLNPEWKFTRKLFRTLAYVSMTAILFMVALALADIHLSFVLLLALPLIILFEIYWYLDGIEKDDVIQDEPVTETQKEENDFDALYNKYLEVWSDKWIIANSHIQAVNSGHDNEHAHNEKGKIYHSFNRKQLYSKVMEDIIKIIDKGGNLLIIVNDSDTLSGYKDAFSDYFKRRNITFGEISETNDFDGVRVLIGTPYKVSSMFKKIKQWVNNLELVLINDIDNTFKYVFYVSSCIRQIHAEKPDSKYIVYTCSRDNIQQSLNSFLPIQFIEQSVNKQSAQDIYCIVWQLDGAEWPQKALFNDISDYLGNEFLLSLLAIDMKFENVSVLKRDSLSWIEHCEDINKHRSSRKTEVLNNELDEGKVDGVNKPVDEIFLDTFDSHVVFVRDTTSNLSMAYQMYESKAEQKLLLNIISPPYLLREYFADNIEYFMVSPMLPFSPMLARDRYNTAFECITTMMVGYLQESEILEKLGKMSSSCHKNAPIEMLDQLIYEQLGFSVLKANMLEPEKSYRLSNGKLIEIIKYRLKNNDDIYQRLSWLTDVNFISTDRPDIVLYSLPKGMVTQKYLEGQIHLIAGQMHKIMNSPEQQANGSYTLQIKHDEPVELYYRNNNKIQINKNDNEKDTNKSTRIMTIGYEISESSYKCPVTVDVSGYTAFKDKMSMTQPCISQFLFNNNIIRAHDKSNIFSLSFIKTDSEEQNGSDAVIEKKHDFYDKKDKINLTLTVLLQEMMPTFFPENHNYVHCCSIYPFKEVDNYLKPVINEFILNDDALDTKAFVQLFIIEDAPIDMGIAQSFRENYKEIFGIVYDYLDWYNNFNKNEIAWRRNNNLDTCLLKYGKETLAKCFDMVSTQAFLDDVFRYSEDKNSLSVCRESAMANSVISHCDFCGIILEKGNFENMSDGRQRCFDCKKIGVDTIEQLKSIYNKAYDAMTSVLNVTINEDVTVEFVNAQAIAEETDERVNFTNGYDPRTSGLAISGSNKRIMIENGRPEATTFGTIVHELTHIWQYENLDFDKIPDNDDGSRHKEGHAVWASIKAIETLYDAPNQVRAWKENTDPIYGDGYRMLVAKLAESGETDAFALMLSLFKNQ